MKTLQQGEYISIQQGCQQLKLEICGVGEYKAEKDEFYRQVSAQLEELDYGELYSAYSGMIRKSQVEPRILFEILVCAYMEGVYSSRKIEQLCRNHIQFILLLDGHEPPDHCTIARFRSGEATGKAIEGLFWQYANKLAEKGWIDRDELYVDGTKIESKANRYTFVWRKTVERELGKIREKARKLLGLESGYATRGKLKEQVEALDKEISAEGLTVQKGRGHHKPEKIRRRDEQKELLDRWESYEQKKEILGAKRNSYSKTDPDATFMHMKDDHMRNGQLKPGYNVQFAVNSQFIVGLGVFADRTDYATLPPMLETLKERLGFRFRQVVADSGYESLENYRYLERNDQRSSPIQMRGLQRLPVQGGLLQSPGSKQAKGTGDLPGVHRIPGSIPEPNHNRGRQAASCKPFHPGRGSLRAAEAQPKICPIPDRRKCQSSL